MSVVNRVVVAFETTIPAAIVHEALCKAMHEFHFKMLRSIGNDIADISIVTDAALPRGGPMVQTIYAIIVGAVSPVHIKYITKKVAGMGTNKQINNALGYLVRKGLVKRAGYGLYKGRGNA